MTPVLFFLLPALAWGQSSTPLADGFKAELGKLQVISDETDYRAHWELRKKRAQAKTRITNLLKKLLDSKETLPPNLLRSLYALSIRAMTDDRATQQAIATALEKTEGDKAFGFLLSRAKNQESERKNLAPVIGRLLENKKNEEIHQVMESWLKAYQYPPQAVTDLVQGPAVLKALINYLEQGASEYKPERGKDDDKPNVIFLEGKTSLLNHTITAFDGVISDRPHLLDQEMLTQIVALMERAEIDRDFKRGMAFALAASHNKSTPERKEWLSKKARKWLTEGTFREKAMAAIIIAQTGDQASAPLIAEAIGKGMHHSVSSTMAFQYLEAIGDGSTDAYVKIIEKWPLLGRSTRPYIFEKIDKWQKEHATAEDKRKIYRAYATASRGDSPYANLCDAICGLYQRISKLEPAARTELGVTPPQQLFPWLGLKYLFLLKAQPYCQKETGVAPEVPIKKLKELWTEGQIAKAIRDKARNAYSDTIYSPNDMLFAPAIGTLLLDQMGGTEHAEWRKEFQELQALQLKHPDTMANSWHAGGKESGMTTYALAFTALATDKPELKSLKNAKGNFHRFVQPYSNAHSKRNKRASVGRSAVYNLVRLLRVPSERQALADAGAALDTIMNEAPALSIVAQTHPFGNAHIGVDELGYYYPYASAPFNSMLIQVLESHGQDRSKEREQMEKDTLGRIGPDGLFALGVDQSRFYAQSLGGLGLLGLIGDEGCFKHKGKSSGILPDRLMVRKKSPTKPRRKVGALIRDLPNDPFRVMRIEFTPAACVAD